MPSNNRRLIAVVVLLGMVVSGAGTLIYMRDYYRHESVAMVGHPLPTLGLIDLYGELVGFDGFRGRPLLATFIQTDCGHCRDQLAVLEKLHVEFADKLAIVVISTNNRTETVRFFKDITVSFPVWVDSQRNVYKKLGAINVPALFLLDKDGILRHATLGYQSFQDTRRIFSTLKRGDSATNAKVLDDPQ